MPDPFLDLQLNLHAKEQIIMEKMEYSTMEYRMETWLNNKNLHAYFANINII